MATNTRATRAEPCAYEIWVRRRRPIEREVFEDASGWVLFVAYRADGNEYAARLPLSRDGVARQVDRLLAPAQRGNHEAARKLFACLHEEWGQVRLVRRHPAWDAVFRYLAPLAAAEPAQT